MTSDAVSWRDQVEQKLLSADYAGARDLLWESWRKQASPSLAPQVIRTFDRLRGQISLAPLRMFVLRSFTVEPALPMLRAEAFFGGIDLTVAAGEFGAYAQEILDPESGLYKFAPDVVVMAVHTRSVLPELFDGTTGDSAALSERVLGTFTNALEMLRQRTAASIIVHNLDLPPINPGGLWKDQEAGNAAAFINDINRQLVGLARSHRSCYVLDFNELAARVGRDQFHDERKWQTARLPLTGNGLVALSREWRRFLQPISGRVCKVLVTDLDNTLWGGVLGEDGSAKLRMDGEYPGVAYRSVQTALKAIARRGVLLAVCSKNDEPEVRQVLESHPDMLLRSQDFASLQVNWEPKPVNLRRIAEELNVGLDSLAFLDDNPAERALMRAELPEVTVLDWPEHPLDIARAVLDSPVFERLTVVREDTIRQQQYAEQQQRAALAQSAASLTDFYHSLSQKLIFAPVTAQTLQRAVQLTQKTNQFNLTTKRYNEQQVQNLLEAPGWLAYTTQVTDHFGDNGIVGLVMGKLEDGAFSIDTFLLSCRVIGRTVETAMLAALSEICLSHGAQRMRGWFLPTAKNGPARSFYQDHGFSLISQDGAAEQWEREISSGIACPAWIELAIKQELAFRVQYS